MNNYLIKLPLIALFTGSLYIHPMTQPPLAQIIQQAFQPLALKKDIMKSFGLARSRNPLNDRLFRLCASGTAEEIKAVIDAGANPAAQADYIERKFDVIELQNEQNSAKKMGITPFQEAVRLGNEEAVKEFVRHGGSLNDPLLLFWASQGMYLDIFKYLVEHGAPIDQFVSSRYDMNIAFPEENKAYKEQSIIVSLIRGYRDMAMMFFEMHSHDKALVERLKNILADELRECVALLKEAGLDLTMKDRQKRTALHAGALDRNAEGVKALVDAGANVNEQDYLGNTPLHYALSKAKFTTLVMSSRVVDLLLSAGANLMVRNNDGETAGEMLLYHAAHGNLFQTDEFTSMQLLLNAGYIFNRLPEIDKWHYSFDGEKGGLDTLQYKKVLAESLLNIAPFAYGILVPSEEELKASRSRLSALMVYFKNFHRDEITAPDPGLLCGHVRSKIMLADNDMRQGYTYQQDLFAIFLDHLRWGNPLAIDNIREAQVDLIEIMANRLFNLYTSRLTKYEDPAVTAADPETEALKKSLHDAVKKGIKERMQALAQFGQKTKSAGIPLQTIHQMLSTTFPESTSKWKDYFLKTHGLNPAQNNNNDDDNINS